MKSKKWGEVYYDKNDLIIQGKINFKSNHIEKFIG